MGIMGDVCYNCGSGSHDGRDCLELASAPPAGYAFNQYQKDAIVTAAYPGQGSLMGLAYASLGLTGEAGETVEQVKKTWRDDGVTVETFGEYQVTGERREKILKELGDLLWYAAQICTELRADLGDVAAGNIAKLRTRQANNLIHGEGSDREVSEGRIKPTAITVPRLDGHS
jgi:NTP pyrophosphatase (non-canonical NTP hydrolase)